ncbi:NAD-dependent epimerase/dehydratase family protein [Variovorax sp. YR216]|uniref:NAD-dependent epimerase/dehydratase family protein n=1 Tax=Variovorax sp. YR216 TaxID=1882828 RepID=UPI00089BD642|nr:NAD-dependent epimerase/dehydratase family protein [Variovorax sp. YR216]SEB18830.1 Nucleoside-diphosphate-sugar epimerase [Variovorax sp. YR216]
MKVLVTGAGGFIGAHLLGLLRSQGAIGGRAIDSLVALDHRLDSMAGVITLEGDLACRDIQRRIAQLAPDVCFHLAAVPGGAAEADPLLSRRINLDATLDLFQTLADAAPRGRAPVVVYASTIAVYGSPLPDPVTPATPLRPPMVYGAHKLACEILLTDFTRRGLLDGRSLRLPGIVARPRAPSGLVSAFMSDLMHALAAGEPFTCPVSADATAWWMSARRCVQNLAHAASMDPGNAERAWPLPVLRLSISQVVHTLSRIHAVHGERLVRYSPQRSVEAVFGRYPVLDDRVSRALGLRDDGTPEALVRRALDLGYRDQAAPEPAWA